MICGECANARKNSRDGVFCLLYGILIYAKHEGCKYHEMRDKDATGQYRDEIPDTATGTDG